MQKPNQAFIKEWREWREYMLTKYIRIDLSGECNLVSCNVCRVEEAIANPFVPFSKPVERVQKNGSNFNRRVITSKYIKDAKAQVKFFQDRHFESCIKNLETV